MQTLYPSKTDVTTGAVSENTSAVKGYETVEMRIEQHQGTLQSPFARHRELYMRTSSGLHFFLPTAGSFLEQNRTERSTHIGLRMV